MIVKAISSGDSEEITHALCSLHSALSQMNIIISFFFYLPGLQVHKVGHVCESNLHFLEGRSDKPKTWYCNFFLSFYI